MCACDLCCAGSSWVTNRIIAVCHLRHANRNLSIEYGAETFIYAYTQSATTFASIMATEAAARKFFSAPFFAVVGASSNPAKFGHKGARAYISICLHLSASLCLLHHPAPALAAPRCPNCGRRHML